jgi:twitching motility protein PilU
MQPIEALLQEMIARKASDLYLTYDSPAGLRVNEQIVPLGPTLNDDDLTGYLHVLLNESQRDEYASTLELNTSFHWSDEARFRINVFRQQGHDGVVIRRIQTEIPSLDSLALPPLYGELALAKRGLILLAGPTGSGKTTSLAAMVGYRNQHGSGHIITIEDPIEFVHRHHHCIITQRDVGLDTYSYAIALKNALRQRPDMVVIGEIRDREVMEQAIYFAETGHLCIATLHANNSSQAIERVLNFFPEEMHQQILLNLALNLRAVLSQRLVADLAGSRSLALEIMLNSGLIRQLIQEGKIRQIREMIEKGRSEGMQSFDQALLALYKDRRISEEVAIAESDNPANLRLQITNSKGTTRIISRDMMLKQATGGKPVPGTDSNF